jgi:hypothetical protein
MREKLRELLAALTEGCEPGPWHAVENSDSPFRWWLENAAGDSSYPDPADVALMVNALPELLDRLDRLEGALRDIRNEAQARIEQGEDDEFFRDEALAALEDR